MHIQLAIVLMLFLLSSMSDKPFNLILFVVFIFAWIVVSPWELFWDRKSFLSWHCPWFCLFCQYFFKSSCWHAVGAVSKTYMHRLRDYQRLQVIKAMFGSRLHGWRGEENWLGCGESKHGVKSGFVLWYITRTHCMCNCACCGETEKVFWVYIYIYIYIYI